MYLIAYREFSGDEAQNSRGISLPMLVTYFLLISFEEREKSVNQRTTNASILSFGDARWNALKTTVQNHWNDSRVQKNQMENFSDIKHACSGCELE